MKSDARRQMIILQRLLHDTRDEKAGASCYSTRSQLDECFKQIAFTHLKALQNVSYQWPDHKFHYILGVRLSSRSIDSS